MKIQYYEATDDGLVNVHPDPELWALESDLERWYELRNDDANKDKSNVEISELVLDEDWPSKLKKDSR